MLTIMSTGSRSTTKCRSVQGRSAHQVVTDYGGNSDLLQGKSEVGLLASAEVAVDGMAVNDQPEGKSAEGGGIVEWPEVTMRIDASCTKAFFYFTRLKFRGAGPNFAANCICRVTQQKGTFDECRTPIISVHGSSCARSPPFCY
jgi:hypothetical protein